MMLRWRWWFLSALCLAVVIAAIYLPILRRNIKQAAKLQQRSEEQARRELMGEENNTPPEETPDNADLTEEWSVIASSRGHRIPRPGTEEEETIGEQCVVDGLEEAAHDQMLEARLEELQQEGEIL